MVVGDNTNNGEGLDGLLIQALYHLLFYLFKYL